MIFLAIAVLFLLALVNYLLSRSPVFPSVAFCAVWAIDLLLIVFAGDMFYPLSAKTLTIYCAGAVAFSLGALCARLFPCRAVESKPAPSKTINWMLTLVALGGIYVYHWSVGLAAGISDVPGLAAVRMVMVEQGTATDLPSRIAMEIIGLAVIVAMICFYEKGGKRKTFALFLALTLVMLTGSRSASVILVLAVVAMDWLKRKRIQWKLIGGMGAAILVIFSTVAIFLSNGDVQSSASFGENLAPIKNVFLLYAAGGVVGFDRVVREPNIIPHSWQVANPVLLVLNKFGARFDVPSQAAQFINVGPHSLGGNVYTMYFAFIDWGIAGTMALTLLAGLMSALFYQRAMNGHKTSAILYGYLFAACILSVFSEYFFDANFIAKLALVGWCVYHLPDFIHRISRFLGRAVERDIVAAPAARS